MVSTYFFHVTKIEAKVLVKCCLHATVQVLWGN